MTVIRIIGARFLDAMDMNGKSDPFVKVTNGSDKHSNHFTTKTIVKTLSPVWNETFHFDKLFGDSIKFEIFDADYLTSDFMCHITLNVSDVINKPEKWYKLSESLGEIKLQILDRAHFEALPQLPALHYKICYNKLAGSILAVGKLGSVMTHNASYIANSITTLCGGGKTADEKTTEPQEAASSGSAWRSFPVYRVDLQYVDSVFSEENANTHTVGDHVPQTRQGWNKGYHNAIKIFGPSQSAKLVRAGVVAEHKLLFGSKIGAQKGDLYTGENLLNLINFGYLEKRTRMYTYVIMEKFLYFAETGASFAKDFLSKHAVLSNCSAEVVFSGEFHLQGPCQKGEYTLIVDNNSGTYSPDKHSLVMVEELFKKNFPGLKIEGYDRDDPKLRHYKEVIKLRNAEIEDGRFHNSITTEELGARVSGIEIGGAGSSACLSETGSNHGNTYSVEQKEDCKQ